MNNIYEVFSLCYSCCLMGISHALLTSLSPAATITFARENTKAANCENLASLREWLVPCGTRAEISGFGLQWGFLSLFRGFTFLVLRLRLPGLGHARQALTSPLNWVPVLPRWFVTEAQWQGKPRFPHHALDGMAKGRPVSVCSNNPSLTQLPLSDFRLALLSRFSPRII